MSTRHRQNRISKVDLKNPESSLLGWFWGKRSKRLWELIIFDDMLSFVGLSWLFFRFDVECFDWDLTGLYPEQHILPVLWSSSFLVSRFMVKSPSKLALGRCVSSFLSLDLEHVGGEMYPAESCRGPQCRMEVIWQGGSMRNPCWGRDMQQTKNLGWRGYTTLPLAELPSKNTPDDLETFQRACLGQVSTLIHEHQFSNTQHKSLGQKHPSTPIQSHLGCTQIGIQWNFA